MSFAQVVWVYPPSKLERPILDYQKKVVVAIRALADYFAQLLQDDARRSAPWQDRTGAARTGLFGIAEQAAQDFTTIYLSHGHTVFYGVFLEVCNGGKYAVIMPTIHRHLPEIEARLKQLLA